MLSFSYKFIQPGMVLTILMVVMAPPAKIHIHADNTVKSRIAREIVLQEEMETSIRETFKKLFEIFTTDSASYSDKIMYVCDKNCLDFCLYDNGVTAAFIIAVLSNRRFSIHHNLDSPFYSCYEPAVYEWKENKSEVRHEEPVPLIPPRRKRQFLSEVHTFERKLNILDFDSLIKGRTIYLQGNFDWTLDLRRHARTAVKMPWLYMTHNSDVIRLVHTGLFRSPEPVKEMINTELIEKLEDNQLVCFHGNDKKYTSQINSFLEFARNMQSNGSMYYISGNDELREFVDTYRPEINHKLVRINNTFIYDRMTRQKQNINQKNIKHLIDSHVLKLCDTLITSEGPPGVLAARLRRREDHLYCYRDGVIFPCTRGLISGSFRDRTNVPEYIDVDYYCAHTDAAECTRMKRKKAQL